MVGEPLTLSRPAVYDHTTSEQGHDAQVQYIVNIIDCLRKSYKTKRERTSTAILLRSPGTNLCCSNTINKVIYVNLLFHNKCYGHRESIMLQTAQCVSEKVMNYILKHQTTEAMYWELVIRCHCCLEKALHLAAIELLSGAAVLY